MDRLELPKSKYQIHIHRQIESKNLSAFSITLKRRNQIRFALSGKTLSIDFDAEALADCEYEIAYTDTGLELTAGKGTATQGEKFTLNRTEK